jgi:hypothetical protein
MRLAYLASDPGAPHHRLRAAIGKTRGSGLLDGGGCGLEKTRGAAAEQKCRRAPMLDTMSGSVWSAGALC